MESPQEMVNKSKTGQFQPNHKLSRGRPKGSVSITATIKRKLTERYPDASNADKRTYLEVIVQTILDKAIEEKDSKTLKHIWSYIDGQPRTSIGLEVDNDNLSEMTAFFREMAKPKVQI